MIMVMLSWGFFRPADSPLTGYPFNSVQLLFPGVRTRRMEFGQNTPNQSSKCDISVYKLETSAWSRADNGLKPGNGKSFHNARMSCDESFHPAHVRCFLPTKPKQFAGEEGKVGSAHQSCTHVGSSSPVYSSISQNTLTHTTERRSEELCCLLAFQPTKLCKFLSSPQRSNYVLQPRIWWWTHALYRNLDHRMCGIAEEKLVHHP